MIARIEARTAARVDRARRLASLVVCLLLLSAASVFAQEYIRVPPRQTHTDVKLGPSSGSIVLVLIPSGTELPIVKRDGEWIQVRLSPDLRKSGIPMRWYEGEALGFVHESTVDVIKGTPAAKPASQEPPASQPPRQYVRVPARQSNTDIKAEPNSGSIVLLLVPSGTVLPVTGRRGEWIQVRLSPDLRRVGTVMRWYRNEETGFVHESTVEGFTK
jgi:uncharacterized protein YgiM (DUF1202 family)